jgi:hypothetical protein
MQRTHVGVGWGVIKKLSHYAKRGEMIFFGEMQSRQKLAKMRKVEMQTRQLHNLLTTPSLHSPHTHMNVVQLTLIEWRNFYKKVFFSFLSFVTERTF